MLMNRNRVGLWALALVMSLCATVATTSAQGGDQVASPTPEPNLTEEERAEASRLLKVMDTALSGESVPSDIRADVSLEFLRAQEGQVYVPFTLRLNPATVGQSVTVYVRLVPTGMVLTPPVAPESAETGTERVPLEPPSYPFEDVHFIDLRLAEEGDYVAQRAFAAPAGSYDLYIGIKDSELVETEFEEIRWGVIKRTVEVPDLWSGQLTTSSIFVTDRVETIPTPLSAEQQRSDPYAIGSARLVIRDTLEYSKTDSLSFLFFIYNPRLIESKPNVTVEYHFHQRSVGGEEFFNSTTPQNLSAETLPPQLDMTAGHQLSAGQNIPLSAFPEGIFRLEIKITDNELATSISRDVTFTVVGS